MDALRDAAAEKLRQLRVDYPLEAAWGEPQLFVEPFSLLGQPLELVGLLAADESGRELTGSAADLGSAAVCRAYFELLERAGAIHATDPKGSSSLRERDGAERGGGGADANGPGSGTGWLASRSNGVAAHPSWRQACRAAWLEAIERDRVLRAWYLSGQAPPAVVEAPTRLRVLSSHEVQVHRFEDPDDPCQNVEVWGVFLFPRADREPFCCGFGAGATSVEALRKAEIECVQRLGFLQGEALPDAPPTPTPTPEFHLDFFLYPPHHARIRRWLCEGLPPARVEGGRPTRMPMPHFADLTPPSLRGRASVARAVDPGRMPLGFGEGHPWILDADPDARTHPIA